jgi:hypothetical protein
MLDPQIYRQTLTVRTKTTVGKTGPIGLGTNLEAGALHTEQQLLPLPPPPTPTLSQPTPGTTTLAR